MKRLLLIFVLVYTVPCYGQTFDLRGTLTAKDADGNSQELTFAIHPDASDEYDGDYDQRYFDVLSPPPPPEGPYIYSLLPDDTRLIEDWRGFGTEEDWRVEWKIVYQSVDHFDWGETDFPADEEAAAFTFRIEGGKTVNMRETSTYDVGSDNSGTAWITAAPGLAEITYHMEQGWNLIGLPLRVENSDYEVLFPEATEGSLFSWNGEQYESEGWLVAGRGYWIHFDQPQTYTIEGEALREVTWNLDSQWSLVSPPNCTVSSPDLSKPFTNVYGWDREYTWGIMRLQEGSGYWWRGSGDYKIECDSESLVFVESAGKRYAVPDNPGAPPSPPSLSMIEPPETFHLQGNYPNPFNPSTNVALDLPESAVVTVQVSDILGRQVMEIERELAPGSQRIRLEMDQFQSGVYLYRVTAEMTSETVTKTDRMMLLK